MSVVNPPIKKNSDPPRNTVQSPNDGIGKYLDEVTGVVAPVWPLQDYVAVNPYAGISHHSFFKARAFLRGFSDFELLMPLEFYAKEFQKGRFSLEDIQTAIDEFPDVQEHLCLSAVQIEENIQSLASVKNLQVHPTSSSKIDHPIRTVVQLATKPKSVDWTEAITDEISKHCAAHYDQGQAFWTNPYQAISLYDGWRKIAAHDLNIEILGLKGFRKYVSNLPTAPETAILQMLSELGVPAPLWSRFLLCQAYSIPGWSAWAKYQSHWTDRNGEERKDLTGLLAIRLAYDAALAQVQSIQVDWSSMLKHDLETVNSLKDNGENDSYLRYVLLRASEIGYRNRLLQSFALSSNHQTSNQSSNNSDRKLAQLVFCIDVRSERMRRQLETLSSDIETYGFAGFFGMPLEYVSLGEATGRPQLPVLLKPQFKVFEGFHDFDDSWEKLVAEQRKEDRSWLSAWKSFSTSAFSCFSFVETAGLFFGTKLLWRAIGWKPNSKQCNENNELGPTLRGLTQQGITTSRQADMAEGMLRNLGLVEDFAKLVVFCGHGAATDNNPLAAGLDCGACGGHSGQPNARFAALLLNQPYIRKSLAERGIEIPSETHFLAAVHNTTTDAIEFFDVAEVPVALKTSLEELRVLCSSATTATRTERLPTVASKTMEELLRRATDWSEVRPEWGLAGNASFIVAPRALTKNANLDARSFLHSYDWRQDEDGRVLETIMTAPMIVANWINMQYYASTVDNRHFGSGNKTIHNVVGRFGILAGNSGDLMTGLPWQSLHNGKEYQHLPMRLQVVIAAPREMINRIVQKHKLVADLLNGAWVHLVAIEEGEMYRYAPQGTWEKVFQSQPEV